MAYFRRRAVLSGVFGGSRKWLVWGGAAWMAHWTGRLLGVSDPTPRYTQELGPGQRVVVVHEPDSPLDKKKAARRERRAARRARRTGA